VQQAMQKMPMEYVTYMNAESDAYAFWYHVIASEENLKRLHKIEHEDLPPGIKSFSHDAWCEYVDDRRDKLPTWSGSIFMPMDRSKECIDLFMQAHHQK
jgi:hypothetical protein